MQNFWVLAVHICLVADFAEPHLKYEPENDKACAQRRLGSAWTSAQFDQSLCRTVLPVNTQICLDICPVWSVFAVRSMPRLICAFAGCTGHFVGALMLWLILWSSLTDASWRPIFPIVTPPVKNTQESQDLTNMKSDFEYLQKQHVTMVHMNNYYTSPVKRKCVFGNLSPGNIQTSLLSYRDKLESWILDLEARDIVLSKERRTKALISLRRLICAFVLRICHKTHFRSYSTWLIFNQYIFTFHLSVWFSAQIVFLQLNEKTCLQGLRPGKTRTGLLCFSIYKM